VDLVFAPRLLKLKKTNSIFFLKLIFVQDIIIFRDTQMFIIASWSNEVLRAQGRRIELGMNQSGNLAKRTVSVADSRLTSDWLSIPSSDLGQYASHRGTIEAAWATLGLAHKKWVTCDELMS
jgi:hypothetical protein